MKKFVQAFSLALSLALMAGAARAQRRGSASTKPAPAKKMAVPTNLSALAGLPLPASDSVAIVETRKLLSEALPSALASDKTKLAEVNADIDKFKTKTGIDPRAFDLLAVGSRFVTLPDGKLKLDNTVAVGRGTFQMSSIVSAGTASSGGKHRAETYAGKTIHVFTLNEEMKLFGLLKMRVGELAVTELSANTLAVGDPSAVRSAVDAASGRGALKGNELAVFSQPRAANTLVAFGSLVPKDALRDIQFGSPVVTQGIQSVRELYGTLGSTQTGFDLQTNLRTLNAADAKNLSETLTAVRQLAPLFLGRLQGDQGRLARNAVDSLRITQAGNEVKLQLEIPQADIAALVRTL